MAQNKKSLYATAPQNTSLNDDLDYSGVVKDSLYFMKDDGEFSPEEKDSEALYIYQQCNSNHIQRLYYDCGCVAGKFRQARDVGQLVPQSTILNGIYSDSESNCANTIGIAGNSYQNCKSYSKVYRSRERPEKTEEFCKCVANKTANDFSKNTSLNLRKIERIQSKAMVVCNKLTL